MLNSTAQITMLVLTVLSGLIIVGITIGLFFRARPILILKPLSEVLFSSSWHPLRGAFGFLPFIMGSMWVTAVATILAVPLCILTAIFLSEYATERIREIVKPFIDVLAGIPSVVYGVWGVLTVVPFVQDHLAPLFGLFSTGYCSLSAGIVLAIMIVPVIIHVTLEVLRSIPQDIREASLSLGATSWQTTKYVVVKKAMPGIIAACVLGLSRAFGETMAVLMVAGNVAQVPRSIFDPAYPLPALIANNYGEMLSVPLYDSALLLASFILLAVVLIFNIISKSILIRIEGRFS
jgi:phosphate transport system permease protein